MKTFTLVICFIGTAALLAGFAGPASDGSTTPQIEVPAFDMAAPAQDFTMPTDPNEAVPKATCYMCSSSSTGACSGAKQCRGSRKGCRKKGCKITGTSSCSSSANVKKC